MLKSTNNSNESGCWYQTINKCFKTKLKDSKREKTKGAKKWTTIREKWEKLRENSDKAKNKNCFVNYDESYISATLCKIIFQIMNLVYVYTLETINMFQ